MTDKKTDRKQGKKNMRRTLLLVSIVMITILTILSVIGAFLGQRVASFFGSPPLAALWIAFTLLFGIGFGLSRNLRKKPGLLLSHLGCLLLLLGALWGTEQAHQWRASLFGTEKLHKGYMQIYKGQATSVVISPKGIVIGQLPFNVKLNDFWIEYYEEISLLEIKTPDGREGTIPAVEGEHIALGNGLPNLRISRIFQNFKISIEDGNRYVTDKPEEGSNPALEVELTFPNGSRSSRYVFQEEPGEHDFSHNDIHLIYHYNNPSGIKDYKSDLLIIDGDKVVKQKEIEVNAPLHYNGYDFYQFDYDHTNGSYTVLGVVSDSGLLAVYAGYLLLSLGIMWQFWFRHIPGYIRNKR